MSPLPVSRRTFLATTAVAGLATRRLARADERPSPTEDELARIVERPVLDVSGLDAPLVIRSLDLLRNGSEYLVRVRTKGGDEAVAVANSARLEDAFPIFLNRVAPFFVGKDARQLEPLLFDLYRHASNYKWQGLAFWVCVAAAEVAILELLGRAAGKSVGELFGGVQRKRIAVYRASGNRGNRPEEEVAYLAKLLEETGGKAVKFRLGGRMSRNRDSHPGRTEALIPLARRELGDDAVLYADANSSYDVENAIRIGRLLKAHDYAFFEEPCPFDHLWETKRVADALDIPVAGGEQEYSLRRFRWTIANRGVDIVQPDLHYFGGLVRSTRVARMAEAAGLPCTPHMSGAGLGYLYVTHFAASTTDPGPHQEFKGTSDIPFECRTSTLKPNNGFLDVPTGPGFGIDLDPKWVSRAEVVTR